MININKIVRLSLLFIVATALTKNSQAQVPAKKDTIYYLIDTVTTTKENRLITIQNQNEQNFLIIHCPCLYKGNEPVFRYNSSLYTTLKKSSIKAIKFAYLKNLIEVVRKNDN
jgi:hypothetical protein